jgi:hypothetical protein
MEAILEAQRATIKRLREYVRLSYEATLSSYRRHAPR